MSDHVIPAVSQKSILLSPLQMGQKQGIAVDTKHTKRAQDADALSFVDAPIL